MSEAQAVYAVCWDRHAATEALNERRIELGLSLVELDHAAKQAAGTAAKYLSPGQIKTLGVESLFKLAGTLGLRLVFEIDQTATTSLLERSRQRHASQARTGNFAQKCSQRTVEPALRHMALLPWSEVLAAVAEMRAKVAAEQAAKAAKEEAESAAKGAKPSSARTAAPSVSSSPPSPRDRSAKPHPHRCLIRESGGMQTARPEARGVL